MYGEQLLARARSSRVQERRVISVLVAWVRLYMCQECPHVYTYIFAEACHVRVCMYIDMHAFAYVPRGMFLCALWIYSVETVFLSVCERKERAREVKRGREMW